MILNYKNFSPQIHESVFVAPNATVIGQTTIGKNSSIWFGTVIRGDVNQIQIGERTNVQDLSVIHVSSHESKKPSPTVLGNDVVVGHHVILHGCKIEDGALVGMGSTVMDGAIVGEGALVGAGSLVTEGTKIPPRTLAMGRPAKVIRELSDDESRAIQKLAEHYVSVAKDYSETKT